MRQIKIAERSILGLDVTDDLTMTAAIERIIREQTQIDMIVMEPGGIETQ